MGLLERAAMEAAKKMAESEESHTDVRGIVKASKVFPVVSSLYSAGFGNGISEAQTE